jgi:hypothetical protein
MESYSMPDHVNHKIVKLQFLGIATQEQFCSSRAESKRRKLLNLRLSHHFLVGRVGLEPTTR